MFEYQAGDILYAFNPHGFPIASLKLLRCIRDLYPLQREVNLESVQIEKAVCGDFRFHFNLYAFH